MSGTLEGLMIPMPIRRVDAADTPHRRRFAAAQSGASSKPAWATIPSFEALTVRLSNGESGSWPNQTLPALNHLSRPIPCGGSGVDPWRH
jgi:hypothetical protein